MLISKSKYLWDKKKGAHVAPFFIGVIANGLSHRLDYRQMRSNRVPKLVSNSYCESPFSADALGKS